MVRLFSVSELLENIKITLMENFPVVEVSGEISDVNVNNKSGHIYFTLKEKDFAISCSCWKSYAVHLAPLIVVGQKVIVRGNISSYKTNSKYYVTVLGVKYYSEGVIVKQIEELKLKLDKEGLFLKPKQPINKYPKSIGLITSMDGAAIHDIKSMLSMRYPCKLYVFDALVQGTNSVHYLVEGIERFNQMVLEKRPDFLILARGGGSEEDLLHFNDEFLVRAIYKSQIPVVTAIGHQINTNLVDLVADKSVITPTAAVASLAIKSEVQETLKMCYVKSKKISYYNIMSRYNYVSQSARLLRSQQGNISNKTSKLATIYRTMKKNCLSALAVQKNNLDIGHAKLYSPVLYIHNIRICLDNKARKLLNFMYLVADYQQKILAMERMLDSLSFKRTLQRGFTIVHKDTSIIKSKEFIINGEYTVEFADGVRTIDIVVKK